MLLLLLCIRRHHAILTVIVAMPGSIAVAISIPMGQQLRRRNGDRSRQIVREDLNDVVAEVAGDVVESTVLMRDFFGAHEVFGRDDRGGWPGAIGVR